MFRWTRARSRGLSSRRQLQQAYSAAAQQSVFAIRDKDGRLIEASTPEIGAIDRPMAAGGFRTQLLPAQQFRALRAGLFRASAFGSTARPGRYP